MKKIFTFISLLLLTFVVGGLIVQALPAPGEGEATVVVHFHKWDENYENVGGHAWEGNVLVEVDGTFEKKNGGVHPTGKDDFGIYFTYRFQVGETAADLGFLAVMAKQWNDDGTIVQNWDAKLTPEDVRIPVKDMAAGEEKHIYVFEGSRGQTADEEKGEVPYLVADPELVNLLVVFFDPSGKYHEDLGVHSWGWAEGYNAAGWNNPFKAFSTVGKMGATDVKAALFAQTPEDVKDSGLLIYHGDGDNGKYTGDIKKDDGATPDLALYAEGVEAGLVVPLYVVSKGAGNASNNNVFYGENLDEFAIEATMFRFELGSYADGKGTFAYNNNTVYTMFNQSIETNFLTLTEEQKAEKKAELISWFSVYEVTGEDKTKGAEVEIEAINFNEYADSASEFILTLKNPLDSTKNYQVQFKEEIEEPAQPVARTITFKTTAPEGTETVYIVGSMNGWTPGRSNWKMIKEEDGSFSYTIEASLLEQTFEYKYVNAASWDYEEIVGGNRKVEIGSDAEILVEDTIAEWKAKPEGEAPAEADEFILPDDEEVPMPKGKEAVEDLELDREAPELIFTTEMKEEDGFKIVEIQQYSKWDPTKFPRYRVNDNRDGNLTHRVYVPSDTEHKILDTNKLGDQKILLRVEDNWGHVRDVIFIFRVVAK